MKVYSVMYINMGYNLVQDWAPNKRAAQQLASLARKFGSECMDVQITEHSIPSKPTRMDLVGFLNTWARGGVR